MTSIEVLKRARAMVAKRWVKHHEKIGLSDGQYAYCAIGAICEAQGFDWLNKAHREFRYSWFAKAVAVKGFREANSIHHIATWNDAKGTSHADVLRAFDVAIAAAESCADGNEDRGDFATNVKEYAVLRKDDPEAQNLAKRALRRARQLLKKQA